MLFLLHLRKEKQGQIGERNKTIILLRASTVTKPLEGASGLRSGSEGQLERLSNKKPRRTQQNDRGFVALAGVGSNGPPRKTEKFRVSRGHIGRSHILGKSWVYNFGNVHRAQKPVRGARISVDPGKIRPAIYAAQTGEKGQKENAHPFGRTFSLHPGHR